MLGKKKIKDDTLNALFLKRERERDRQTDRQTERQTDRQLRPKASWSIVNLRHEHDPVLFAGTDDSCLHCPMPRHCTVRIGRLCSHCQLLHGSFFCCCPRHLCITTVEYHLLLSVVQNTTLTSV